jgi:hypothetical protein
MQTPDGMVGQQDLFDNQTFNAISWISLIVHELVEVMTDRIWRNISNLRPPQQVQPRRGGPIT